MSATSILKRVISPTLYEKIAAPYRSRRANRSYAASNRLAKKILSRGHDKVQRGPFAGLKLLPHAVGSALAPKLIGSYEEELIPIFERIFKKEYNCVIDVGCAEGYYAVGLALRFPSAQIVGFDLNPEALEASARLALHNGVHKRLRFGIECDHVQLNELCKEFALVVCDIEGGEKELIDPAFIPNLRFADLLVEIHPTSDGSSLTSLLCKRFENTHRCTLIKSRERRLEDYPELLTWLSRSEARVAVSEFRPQMAWAFWESLRSTAEFIP